MKNRVQDCSHWCEAIRAWVGEGAAGEQGARIQSHLAACADCRRYAEELRAAAAGLRWLADRPVDPSPGFRARWTRAVEEAARPAGLGRTAAALADWWRGLLLRNLRPALAMTPLWILVLLFRFSTPEASPAPQTAAARSPVEIFRALRLSEQLLAAVPEQPIPARAAPRNPHSTQPRSEGLPTAPTAHAPHLTDLTYVTYLTFPSQSLRAAPPVA